jgi:hypothetical protein
LWLCGYAKKLFPEAEDELDVLRERADIFFVFRGDKKRCLGEALKLYYRWQLMDALKREGIDF